MSDETRPARNYEYRLFPALFVIALGVLFLLRNLDIGFDFFEFHNWWAWLILAAAIAPLTRAVELYRTGGKLDGAVIHYLFVAGAVIIMAVLFLLDLDWGRWWPLFVIMGGLSMLARGDRPRTAK
ncbi:MAG: LiaF transmembrane domain-containing protein [Rhodanobacteraceae bacterium]